MIVSENIVISVELPTDDNVIEKELLAHGIDPLRWAVVAVDGNNLTISVSYDK